MSDVLLEVKNLKKYFDTPKGKLQAVDNVSFTIERGKTLGIVGESGCGKSTTGRTLLRLLEPTSGTVLFEGKDVAKLSKRDMRAMRKDMQIIFQDPFSSLDPKMPINKLISEPIVNAGLIKDKKKLEARVLELMETVGLAPRLYNSYPHELDGGRRQRVGIARALALDPKFIVCDEPVSALDVSIQAQILNLLKKLQKERGLTYVFITHDLSVIYYFADEIAVMYLGKLVEKGDYVRSSLFHNGIFAMGAMQIATQGENGSVYPRTRQLHGVAYGDFKCKDGRYVYIASGYAEKLIAKVFSIIGRSDLIDDPKFNSAQARRENADEMYAIIKDAMLQRTSDEWLDFAREADIPMVRMQHFSEVSYDEQALANGYIQDVTYPSGVTYKIASSPIEMDSIGELHTEPTKAIGTDTEAVLKEHGFTDEQIGQLRAAGIIN